MDARLLALSVPLLAAAGSALVRGSGVRTGISEPPAPVLVQLLQIEGRDASGHLLDWSLMLLQDDKLVLIAEFPMSGGPNGVKIADQVAAIFEYPALRPRQRRGLFEADGWTSEETGPIRMVTNRQGRKEPRRGQAYSFRIERPPAQLVERAKASLLKLMAEGKVRVAILPASGEGSPVRTGLHPAKGSYAWWMPEELRGGMGVRELVSTTQSSRWATGPFWGGIFDPRKDKVVVGVFYEQALNASFDPLSVFTSQFLAIHGLAVQDTRSEMGWVFFFVEPTTGQIWFNITDPRVGDALTYKRPAWMKWHDRMLRAVSERIEIRLEPEEPGRGSPSKPSPAVEIAEGAALLAIPTPLFDLPGLALMADGVRRLNGGSKVRTTLHTGPELPLLRQGTRVRVTNWEAVRRGGFGEWSGDVLDSQILREPLDAALLLSGLQKEDLVVGRPIYYVKHFRGAMWVAEPWISKVWLGGKWEPNHRYRDPNPRLVSPRKGSRVRTNLVKPRPWRFHFNGEFQWGGIYDTSKRKVVLAFLPESGHRAAYDILRLLRETEEDTGTKFNLTFDGPFVPFSIRENDGAVVVPKYDGISEAGREDFRSTIGWSLELVREPA